MVRNNAKKFVKDVIHGEIVLEHPWVIEILKTPEFLRLAKIKQTGLTYTLYPNSTHNRFAHSLGTYCLARRVARQLDCFNNNEVQELVAAALLHDLGHGPHSHCFESYTGVSHENFSVEFILNPKSNINKILSKYKVNPENVVRILNHNHKNELLNDLISSQIDVDRMDYLARDSHFSGVCYGNIDVSMLIKWMHIKNNKLVFSFNAISSIENFLLARYHMFKQIYEQPKIIALQLIVRQMLLRFKELYKKHKVVDYFHLSEIYKPWLLNKKFDIKQYMNLNDNNFEMFIEQMKYEKDPYIAEAYKQFINFSTKTYKVVSYNKENLVKYQKYFSSKTKNIDLYVHKCTINTKLIYNEKTQPILIYDDFKDKIVRLEQVSPIIKSLLKAAKPQNVLVIDNNI